MEDRVEWVHYRVFRDGVPDEGCVLEFTNSAFDLTVAASTAVFNLKIDFENFRFAQTHIGDFLRSWEADVLFQTASTRRDLQFERAQMRSGKGTYAGLRITGYAVGANGDQTHRRQFPWRHHQFASDPLVKSMIDRYSAYREGKELLPVLGYFCLSALEHRHGSRPAVCRDLAVSRNVLVDIATLTSTVGTFYSARKLGRKHQLRDLTAHEVYWLEAALTRLIYQAGEAFTSGSPRANLTMAMLPPK